MNAKASHDGHASIRVLALIQYGEFGGPHGRIACIAPVLANNGTSVIVLLPEGQGDAAVRLRSSGIEVITGPLNRLKRTFDPRTFWRFGSRFLSDIRTIRHLIRDRAIDLVQVHGLLFPQGVLAARWEGVPLVWQLNDQSLPAAMRRAFMPVVKRYADVLMTTGVSTAHAHPGATNLGDRLEVFFPAVDARRFCPDKAKRAMGRQELGVSESNLVVGTIANVNPYKELETFVLAAAKLHREIPTSRFVILGKTYDHLMKYANALWREAARRGLRVGAELIHKDAGARVAELAQAFDMFWLTSGTEGTPNSLVEAMALELPAVATNVGGVREIVEDHATGFVVPPRDVDAFVNITRRLWEDRLVREQIGRRARQSVLERFTPDICARSHLRAYQKAFDHHRLRTGDPHDRPASQ